MGDPEADEEGGAAEPGHHAPDSGCLETKVKVGRSHNGQLMTNFAKKGKREN